MFLARIDRFHIVVLTNLCNNCEILYLFSECILLRSVYIYLRDLCVRISIVNIYQKKKKEMSLFMPQDGFIVITVETTLLIPTK